jgi:AcrR family transcriptional regulator
MAKLSKEIWLKSTLDKVGDVGVASIEVESLAMELKVTKGSFYWHFQSRDSLLSEMLNYWYNSATLAIGLVGKRDFNDPLDRLRYFFTLALNRSPDVPGGPIEQALREWARVSDIAAEMTRRVDQDRISLISDAYIELGQSEDQARLTAEMALAQLIGLNILMRSKSLRHHAEGTKAFLELFLSAKVGEGV